MKPMSTNKSASTRFSNDQVRAKQANLVANPAAEASLKTQTSNVRKPPVGAGIRPAPNLTAPSPVQMPTGGPQAPQGASQNFDPDVFNEEQALNEVVGRIKTDNFMESPRVKDAMESIRLKNMMNAKNPRYQKDPRTLFAQVVSKIGMD